MTRRHPNIFRDTRAGSAAEFALVLPLLLIFLLGTIDIGRLMWTWNRAEKATQMGVRYAVATDFVPAGLASYSFATSGGIPQGDAIPSTAFGTITCTSVSCTCAGTCVASWTTSPNTAAFTNIVNRMKLFLPEITPQSVSVSYGFSGLGYAGDPNGSDVVPLVTVKLASNSVTFQPITFALFNSSFALPGFDAALTMEDGQGSVAN
jgi:Flp pilus assembly protein TadG